MVLWMSVLLILIAFHLPKTIGKPGSDQGLQAASKYILEGLDTSVDPCQDFRAFTCNNWQPRAGIEDYELRYFMIQNVSAVLNGTLQVKDGQTHPMSILKQAYNLCVEYLSTVTDAEKTEQILSFHIAPLDATLKEVWPMLNKQWKKNVKGINLVLLALQMSFWYNAHSFIILYNEYHNCNTSILYCSGIFSHYTNISTIQNDVNDLWKCAGIQRPSRESLNSQLSKVQSLQAHLTNFSYTQRLHIPVSQMKTYLERKGKAKLNLTKLSDHLQPETIVETHGIDQIKQFQDILHTTGDETLMNYLAYSLLVTFRKINAKVTSLKKLPVYYNCIRNLLKYKTRFQIEKILINLKPDNLGETANQELYHMANLVRGGLDNIFSKLPWIGYNSYIEMQDKLYAMGMALGPAYYVIMNETLMNNEFEILMDVLSMNSFLEAHAALQKEENTNWSNLMMGGPIPKFQRQFPRFTTALFWGEFYYWRHNTFRMGNWAMWPPFYRHDYPIVFKFAEQGFSTGMNMARAFSPQIIWFDKYGQTRNLESETEQQMRRHYETLQYCYGNTTCVTNSTGHRVCHANQEWDWWQLWALQAAFDAFKTYKARYPREGTQKIPDLEQYSPEQMFFIRFGRHHCKESARDGKYYWQNLVLKNMPIFANTFNCTAGSAMNPKNSCKIFGEIVYEL